MDWSLSYMKSRNPKQSFCLPNRITELGKTDPLGNENVRESTCSC